MLPPESDATKRKAVAMRTRKHSQRGSAGFKVAGVRGHKVFDEGCTCLCWTRKGHHAFRSDPLFRLCQSEHLFERVLSFALCAGISQAPRRGRIRIVRGTVITVPGFSGTGWRLYVVFDPVHGMFHSLEITEA